MRLKKRLDKIEALIHSRQSETEFIESLNEVQQWYECAKSDYMSAENIAKREAQYKELQRIGQKRKEAFYKGEPMSNYPLPWEKDAKP